jgi:hypothetical protein
LAAAFLSASLCGFRCGARLHDVPQVKVFLVEQLQALNQKAINNPTQGLIGEFI